MRLTTPECGDTTGRTGLWQRMRRAGARLGCFSTVSIAALIGLTPVAASADTIIEDFTVSIGGSDGMGYDSTNFADFNPSLGTLTQVSGSITGSTIWSSFGTPPYMLVTDYFGFNNLNSVGFFSTGLINVDIAFSTMDSATLGALTGSVTHYERIQFTDPVGTGSLSSATLDGTITYTYTPPAVPAAVPEPAPFAVLGAGLSGLVFIRRRAAAARSAPAGGPIQAANSNAPSRRENPLAAS